MIGKTWVMYKTWIQARNQEKIPLHHVKLSYQLTIKNLNLKVDHHTGGKCCIHGPKHHKENPLLSLEQVEGIFVHTAGN